MTAQELKARAIDRAKEQHVEVYKLAGTNGQTWLAQSVHREPGAHYTVQVANGKVTSCTCPGWLHWNMCKHAAAVELALEKERAVKAAEQAIRDEQRRRDESNLKPPARYGRTKLFLEYED
ncbi:MAG: SWIM zinc finger domain-containing protein [Chloroflexi bacterium]|nr:SWIM zinc finger domain-containing protein [Chloroflexota bacterium]